MADGSAFASGLVPISTSQTGAFSFNAPLARWKKLRNAVRESARLHELETEGRGFHMIMVTLTYRDEFRSLDAHDMKGAERLERAKDVSGYLDAVRHWHARKEIACRYVWVAELQKRGVLHYHVLFWLPRGIHMPKADKRGWWKHGSTETAQARSPVGYITKYASKIRSKGDQAHQFPKAFRMHGCGGLTNEGRAFRWHHLLPKWARDLGGPELTLRPAKGGGLFSKLTGEWFESPWIIEMIQKLSGGIQITINHRSPA